MIWIAAFFVLLLAVIPLLALAGFRRWQKPADIENTPFRVSVLVPFRNESGRIGPLLASLEHFPAGIAEIIFIDDHSTDDGPYQVEAWVRDRDHARLIASPQGCRGKKHALLHGIHQARWPVILTTDADCRVGPDWVTTMTRDFSDPAVVLAAGLVAPEPSPNARGKWEAMETAALTGISAGSLGLGIPTMCNGANLAFRKKAFFKSGGYDGHLTLPSGDDEFLLHQMHHHFPGRLRYVTNRKALVITAGTQDLREWWQQRIRWSSKWKFHRSLMHRGLGPFLLISYLFLLGGWAWNLYTGEGAAVMAGVTLFKWLADYLLIHRVMQIWERIPSFQYFLLAELFYPFYVMIFAFASFSRQYEWKGRRYKEALT